MLWLFVGPTGVYLLDFFCSGIQFNLLLSPYPCFISLLYLDLYVLGDDALISSQGVNLVTVRGDSLWQLSMMLYEKGYRFFSLGQWFFTSFYAHAKRGVKMVIFDSFRVKFC